MTLAIGNTQSALLWYNIVRKTSARQQAAFDKTPQVRRDVEAFTARAPNISTVDGLLKDRTVLAVVLSAFQLESQVDAKGLLRKLLTEDPADKKSVAYRLADPRFKQFATAMKSLNAGSNPFSDADFRAQIISGYKTNEFEKNQADVNPAVRQAMYFKRMAGNITSLAQLMSDATLKTVARVAGGMPASVDSLEYAQQKPRYAAKIDISKLADSAYVDKVVKNFLVNSDIQTMQDNYNNGVLSPMAGLMMPLSTSDTPTYTDPIALDFTGINLWA